MKTYPSFNLIKEDRDALYATSVEASEAEVTVEIDMAEAEEGEAKKKIHRLIAKTIDTARLTVHRARSGG